MLKARGYGGSSRTLLARYVNGTFKTTVANLNKIPRPRNNHAAAVAGSKIFYCGGWGGKTFLFDIDVLDLGACCTMLTASARTNTLN